MRTKIIVISLVFTLIVICSCSPQPKITNSLEFKGILFAGRPYTQPIGPSQHFILYPIDGGWEIQIKNRGVEEKVLSLGKITLSALRSKRDQPPYFTKQFTFQTIKPERGEGTGYITVLDYGLKKNTLTWVQFTSKLTLP